VTISLVERTAVTSLSGSCEEDIERDNMEGYSWAQYTMLFFLTGSPAHYKDSEGLFSFRNILRNATVVFSLLFSN
jgi:hypothetical protein